MNDEALARIARSGMEQLSVYFRSPDDRGRGRQDQTAPAPVLARSDDFRPEAYGIVLRRAAEVPDTGSGAVATLGAQAPGTCRRGGAGAVKLARDARNSFGIMGSANLRRRGRACISRAPPED